MKQDAAITELVGALLVVALIAGAVGIISVILISQLHPVEKVAGDFELKIDPVSEGAKVYISHIRGDPFQVTQDGEDPSFRVLVNGNEWPVSLSDSVEKNNFSLIKGQANSDYSEYYSSGDTLEAISDAKPETVAFIEIKPDGSEYLLWSYGGNGKEANSVDFYGEPRVACIGEDVSFYDASTNNPDSWEWDFDVNGWDPATPHMVSGTDPNPVHKYAKTGKYTVSLTAGDPALTETKTNYISVQPIVPEFSGTPLFGIDDSPDNPFIVTFTDLSRCGEGESWNWKYTNSINGGETTNSSQEPIEKFIAINNKVTKYSVNFTVYQDSVPYSVNKNNYITVCPKLKPDFSYKFKDDDPFTVIFTDETSGDPSRCKWDFGDEKTQVCNYPNDERIVSHKYEKTGSFEVTLTVYNVCESGIVSDPVNIIIGSSCDKVVAAFELDDPLKKVYAGVNTKFIDKSYTIPSDSSDIITLWDWNFGDNSLNVTGNTPVEQNPSHSFSTSGVFPAMLTVKNACNSKNTSSKNIIVEDCPDFKVDFGYKPTFIIGDEENSLKVVFEANADAPTLNDEIESWTWDFGDINNLTPGYGQNPTHVYENVGESSTFNVILTATNYCGKPFKKPRIVYHDCPDIEQDFSFTATPNTNGKGVIVKFFENSGPDENITSCQWFFGDGTNWTSQDPQNDRTPEDHEYSDWRTYYITEQLQNRCGTIFSKTLPLVVTHPAKISGHLFDDRNLNGKKDANEWDLYKWKIILQKLVNGVWIDRGDPVETNKDGWYEFILNDVDNGVFRVKEVFPDDYWNVTSSYGVRRSGPDRNPVSGQMVIYSEREYIANFTNVEWHVSSLQLPFGYFYPDGDEFSMEDYAWNYFLSYDDTLQFIDGSDFIKPKKRKNTYQVPPYGRFGNSSFSLTIPGGVISMKSYDPPSSSDYWVVGSYSYSGPPAFEIEGDTINILDNNTKLYPPGYTGDKLEINLVSCSTASSWIYPPYEGQEIPYNEKFGIYDGLKYDFTSRIRLKGDNIRCKLISPEEKTLYFDRDPYINWNFGNKGWDNRKYEGKNIKLTTETTFSKNRKEQKCYASRNVFVGYEPLVPVITSIDLNSPSIGNITVKGQVKGHNYDPYNVSVVVGNNVLGKYVFPMTWTDGNAFWNNSVATFNSEPFAGKEVPVLIQATPRFENGYLRGYSVESPVIKIMVPSKNPLKANFTSEPLYGIAPQEVVFTDTSSGGPNLWDWNFGDGSLNITGNSVAERNPVHTFYKPGIYPVTLTIKNATDTHSTYRTDITIANQSNTVSFLSSRKCSLNAGGYLKWVVKGSDSSITVNNTNYLFNDGDITQIILTKPLESAHISIANTINSCNLTSIQLLKNNQIVDIGDCTDINIKEFLAFQSTICINSGKNSSNWINLIWGGNYVSVPSLRNLNINNIIPNSHKYLELKMNPEETFLDGNASDYLIYP
ncbi:MAG: PKD domain-containing protein [Methanomicrobiales archaeon]|nr:PKD domain-containing protein [Methanomicrobiales archaeon]